MKFDFNNALNEGFDFHELEDESSSFDVDVVKYILYKDPEKYYDLDEESVDNFLKYITELIDNNIESALVLVGNNCSLEEVDHDHSGGSDPSIDYIIDNYTDLMSDEQYEYFRKSMPAMALAWMLQYSEDWYIRLIGNVQVSSEPYDYETGYGGGIEIDRIDLEYLDVKDSSGKELYSFHFAELKKNRIQRFSDLDKKLHPEWIGNPPAVRYHEMWKAFQNEYEEFAEDLEYEIDDCEPDYDDWRD